MHAGAAHQAQDAQHLFGRDGRAGVACAGFVSAKRLCREFEHLMARSREDAQLLDGFGALGSLHCRVQPKVRDLCVICRAGACAQGKEGFVTITRRSKLLPKSTNCCLRTMGQALDQQHRSKPLSQHNDGAPPHADRTSDTRCISTPKQERTACCKFHTVCHYDAPVNTTLSSSRTRWTLQFIKFSPCFWPFYTAPVSSTLSSLRSRWMMVGRAACRCASPAVIWMAHRMPSSYV